MRSASFRVRVAALLAIALPAVLASVLAPQPARGAPPGAGSHPGAQPLPAQAARPAAQAAGVSHRYFHFNMCGNKCNDGGLAVADDVINSIQNSSPQPFVITLNEVCRNQYRHLYANLLPYYGWFETTVPGACDNGSDYGIAILVRTWDRSLHGRWRLPGGHEPRSLVCLRTTADGGSQPLIACVTHIDYHSDVQAAQIRHVADRGREMQRDHHVLIAGDFNVTPGSATLDPMYSSRYPNGTGVFNTADAGDYSRDGGGVGSAYNEYTFCGRSPCGANRFWKPTRKLDYIFLSRRDFTGFWGNATSAIRSDHTPLRAGATHV